MSGPASSPVDPRRRFFVHLCLYLAVNLGLVIVTVAVSGGFWWLPFTVVWGVGLVIDGGLAFAWGRPAADRRGLAH